MTVYGHIGFTYYSDNLSPIPMKKVIQTETIVASRAPENMVLIIFWQFLYFETQDHIKCLVIALDLLVNCLLFPNHADLIILQNSILQLI